MRVGIVGAGLMGRWHQAAVFRCGAQVVAIADAKLAAAQMLARAGTAVFTDAMTLLQQAQPDVVHICTPLPTHAALITAALQHGAHVLVEKPLCESATIAEELYVLAQTQARLLCPVHQFTQQAGVQRALTWLPHLGRLQHIEVTIRSAGGARQDATGLEQIVADILPHPLSLLQLWLGAAAGWQVLRPAAGEWRLFTQIEATTVTIQVSMHGRPPLAQAEIVGRRGTIHLDLFHGYAFREMGAVSRLQKVLHPFRRSHGRFWAAAWNLMGRALRREQAYPGLRPFIAQFYGAVAAQNALPVSPQAALAVARQRDEILMELGILE